MATELSQPGIYTPSAPGLPGDALRAELEQLQALTTAQVETILAYAREDGHLASITMWAYGVGRGSVLFHTFEQATGITYEHKLEPNGRAWFNGRAQTSHAARRTLGRPAPGP